MRIFEIGFFSLFKNPLKYSFAHLFQKNIFGILPTIISYTNMLYRKIYKYNKSVHHHLC